MRSVPWSKAPFIFIFFCVLLLKEKVKKFFCCEKCGKFGHRAKDHCSLCGMTDHWSGDHCYYHSDNGYYRNNDYVDLFYGCPDCEEKGRKEKREREQRKQNDFADLVASKVVEKLKTKGEENDQA